MKIGRGFLMLLVAAGLFALAAPVEAGSRGGDRNGGGNFNRGDFHRGDFRRGDGRFHHGFSRVNFFFGGGFGFPWWGYYPYGYYPYGYYPYYGYPAGASYGYDSQGVYNGQVVNGGSGSQASMAAHVQQHLAQAGYYHGPIDGIIGDGTRRAIREYERANGLRVDGRIDDQLLATMGLG